MKGFCGVLWRGLLGWDGYLFGGLRYSGFYHIILEWSGTVLYCTVPHECGKVRW